MTIIPILRRELVAAARQGKQGLHSGRRAFVGMLFVMVVGTFAAWCYWAGGALTSATMARISDNVLMWTVGLHGAIAGMIISYLIRGSLSIVSERERRTLDFLLATRMSSAEIVLGKVAACVVICLSTLAAGFPVMMVLHVVGGIDLGVVLLAYAGYASLTLFLCALALWISAEMPDHRSAASLFGLCFMMWLIGPFSLSVFSPRWGVRLPEWLATANWWLILSSPISVVFHIAMGLRSWTRLVHEVGRMSALQLVGAAVFTIAAIARLRPAHRALAGMDRQARRRERRRLVWRFRPRPPVGDDPILWREKYTSRENGVMKAVGLLIFGGLLVGLAAGTFHFARPAFVELWRHGYGSGVTAAYDDDVNIFARMFIPRKDSGGLIDMARADFNLFIRSATIPIVVMMVFLLGGVASEVVAIERMKETWSSLLATPLGARDILRSAILAALWRTRWAIGAVLVLWTLGLAAGAIHPLGFVVSVLELAASAWMMAVFGVVGAIRGEKAADAAGQGLLLILILTVTGVFPLLLPAGFDSVLWGAGSLPFVAWTSLASYRELPAALDAPLDPHFRWVGLFGGQMPLIVFASWLIAIVGPSLGGLWAWRYTVSHFDRLVGRPHRAAETATAPATPAPHIPTLSGRGSPLAEADGAVIG